MTLPVGLLRRTVNGQPHPLLFVTVSGARLYGFPSPDGDYDLRGVRILPARDALGLDDGRETIEQGGVHDGLETDIVTHDANACPCVKHPVFKC